jgi:2-amino-4-hydroxy-6-hydroxymethyldihydropteridine diphosphokinase
VAEVFLGFGCNLGDRRENIRRGLRKLKEHPKIEIEKISGLYETEPLEMKSKNPFLNGVAAIEAKLIPQKLLTFLEEVEQELGRPKQSKNLKLDRNFDLDILFYNDLVFSIPGLTVPHSQAHRRKFVLIPMLEIAPDFEHPYLKIPLKRVLQELDSPEKVALCPNSTISL